MLGGILRLRSKLWALHRFHLARRSRPDNHSLVSVGARGVRRSSARSHVGRRPQIRNHACPPRTPCSPLKCAVSLALAICLWWPSCLAVGRSKEAADSGAYTPRTHLARRTVSKRMVRTVDAFLDHGRVDMTKQQSDKRKPA